MAQLKTRGKSCCPIERRCCWQWQSIKNTAVQRGKGSKQALQLSWALRARGSDLAQRVEGVAPRLADCLCEDRVTLAEACIQWKWRPGVKSCAYVRLIHWCLIAQWACVFHWVVKRTCVQWTSSIAAAVCANQVAQGYAELISWIWERLSNESWRTSNRWTY